MIHDHGLGPELHYFLLDTLAAGQINVWAPRLFLGVHSQLEAPRFLCKFLVMLQAILQIKPWAPRKGVQNEWFNFYTYFTVFSEKWQILHIFDEKSMDASNETIVFRSKTSIQNVGAFDLKTGVYKTLNRKLHSFSAKWLSKWVK